MRAANECVPGTYPTHVNTSQWTCDGRAGRGRGVSLDPDYLTTACLAGRGDGGLAGFLVSPTWEGSAPGQTNDIPGKEAVSALRVVPVLAKTSRVWIAYEAPIQPYILETVQGLSIKGAIVVSTHEVTVHTSAFPTG